MKLYHLITTSCEEEGVYTDIIKTSKDKVFIKAEMIKNFVEEFNEFFKFDKYDVTCNMIEDNLHISKNSDENSVYFEFTNKTCEIEYDGIVNECNIDCKNDKIEFALVDCNDRHRAYLYSIHEIELDKI